jgi:hypothetical protein
VELTTVHSFKVVFMKYVALDSWKRKFPEQPQAHNHSGLHRVRIKREIKVA